MKGYFSMKNKNVYITTFLILIVLICALLVSCGGGATPSTPSCGSHDGLTILDQCCTECHSLIRITTSLKTSSEWTTTVQRMVARGATLNLDEQQVIVDYLTKNY